MPPALEICDFSEIATSYFLELCLFRAYRAHLLYCAEDVVCRVMAATFEENQQQDNNHHLGSLLHVAFGLCAILIQQAQNTLF